MSPAELELRKVGRIGLDQSAAPTKAVLQDGGVGIGEPIVGAQFHKGAAKGTAASRRQQRWQQQDVF